MTSNALDARQTAIDKLQSETFDMVIIGGGITGVGIAQDAASRGLKIALIERGDYAIGTSSRSSKLIHGGLRYLAQGDFRVTYESCAERALLQKLAPHLVKSLTFLVPTYRWKHAVQLSAGLWLYDIVSKLQNTRFHQRVTVSEAKNLAPMLKTEGLLFGYLYHDCQTNDARLVMEVMKSAVQHGAVSANYLEVIDLIKDGGRIVGVQARDLTTDREIEVKANLVVNSTGVWMDRMRKIDEPEAQRKVRPAKGVHILIERSRIPTKTALLFESAANDGRSLFFIPWYEGTIVGTTDTDFKGEIDSPQASPEDITYILQAIHQVFPEANVTTDDILSSYAGLRPLIDEGGKSTKDISREHRTFESRSGLISIAGGKLTTYRRMACEAVELVLARLKALGKLKSANPSITDKIFLGGLKPSQSLDELIAEAAAQAEAVGVDAEAAEHLVMDYGVNAFTILALTRSRPDLATRLMPKLPFIMAEVVYAAREEQATRVEDFLVRRTRIALLTSDQGRSCVMEVARLIGEELNWSRPQIEQEVARYQQTATKQYAPF
jgi:glycerol-3-phosphate dehydrogenase